MLIALVLSAPITVVYAQAATAQGQLFRSEQHYFSIVFPSGWQLQQSPYPEIIAQALSSNGALVSIGVEQFASVTKPEKDPAEEEIQKELDDGVGTLRQTFPDLRVLDRSVTYMSNRRAGRLLVEFTGHVGDATLPLRMEQVQLSQYGRVFTFAAAAPQDFPLLKQTFQSVLGSFSLEHFSVSASFERNILGKWIGKDGSTFEFRSDGKCAFLHEKHGAVLIYLMEGREPPFTLTFSDPSTGRTTFEGSVSFKGSHAVELDLEGVGMALYTKLR